MGGPTSGHRGVRALLIGPCLQGLLGQLLQVPAGGGADALQRQGHVLLPDEECPHHALGCVQQVCEWHLETGTWNHSPWSLSQTRLTLTSSLGLDPRNSQTILLSAQQLASSQTLCPSSFKKEKHPLWPLPPAAQAREAHQDPGDGDTHPTLLLPRDGDPLKFPLQHHISLPQAPVALPLTLLLVEPTSGGYKGGAGDSSGIGPRPASPAPLCPPHWRSKSLSVFRKSCLARSRMSGSSLEVGGVRGQAADEALAPRSLHCTRCRACGVTCGPHRDVEHYAVGAALAPHQR